MSDPSNAEIAERLNRLLKNSAAAIGDADITDLLRLAAKRLEESLSPYCVCGQEHRPPDDAFEGGRPRKPGCRPLNWREVAERNERVANERRKEGREAHLRAERLEAAALTDSGRQRLLEIADALEEEPLVGGAPEFLRSLAEKETSDA